MHLHTRNVNSAFRELVEMFYRCGQEGRHGLSEPYIIRKPSRNGPVLMIEEPVTITYTHPKERVLFNSARDANPFFHLYEALWMLAGRNDVAPLAYYAENMKSYSDDGKTLNGAYGHRWRHAEHYEWSDPDSLYRSENIDQLKILINHLKADPTSRRAVLQMWNVEDDLLKIGCKACDQGDASEPCRVCGAYTSQPRESSKDVCCNLSVMFSLRDVANNSPKALRQVEQEMVNYGLALHVIREMPKYVLDMTVTNRSNDMIWGMLGANYVHFTFLQEYMAAHLGVEVGRYHHFTNNLHVYKNNWRPEEWLACSEESYYYSQDSDRLAVSTSKIPLVKNPAVFDKELIEVVKLSSNEGYEFRGVFTEPFLRCVARPALCAFARHKIRDYEWALEGCSQIEADDWRIACTQWIEKRQHMWEARQAHKEHYTEFGGQD